MPIRETQQTDAALRLFETALERAPDNINLYRELAYLHLHKGHNNAAVRRFRQGIDQALHNLQFAEGDSRGRAHHSEHMRSSATSAAAPASPRRFEGTFLQLLRTHGEWHTQEWANLFRYFKELQL